MRINPIFHYAEGEGGGAQTPEGTGSAVNQPVQTKPDDFAAALMKALDDRTKRAESGVVKSMAEQYGMTEDEAKAVMEKAKAEKAAKLPENAQKQIDDARAELLQYKITAEVAKEGAALGLLDADVAMKLLPADSIKTDDKGAVTGVKEALEAMQKTKPYLFGARAAMAQRVGGSSPGALSALEEKFYERNPDLRP